MPLAGLEHGRERSAFSRVGKRRRPQGGEGKAERQGEQESRSPGSFARAAALEEHERAQKQRRFALSWRRCFSLLSPRCTAVLVTRSQTKKRKKERKKTLQKIFNLLRHTFPFFLKSLRGLFFFLRLPFPQVRLARPRTPPSHRIAGENILSHASAWTRGGRRRGKASARARHLTTVSSLLLFSSRDAISAVWQASTVAPPRPSAILLPAPPPLRRREGAFRYKCDP